MPPTLLMKGMLEQPANPSVVPVQYVIDYVMASMQRPPLEGENRNPFVNRLLILEARTASGKSVTVPPWIQIAFRSVPRLSTRLVLCTQPRILTTESIPTELDRENYFASLGVKFKLGIDVGYQTSARAQAIRSNGLLYATIGTLEAQLKSEMDKPDRFCRRYSCIVLDEAHERSLIFDSTMALLKIFFTRNAHRDDLPFLCLMSATFDVVKYASFFNVLGVAAPSQEELKPASPWRKLAEEAARLCPNIIRVGGASHPIETRWSETSVVNIYEGTLNRVWRCIDEELETHSKTIVPGASYDSPNKILVFVPGQSDSRQILKQLVAAKLIQPGTLRAIPGTNEQALVVVSYYYVDSNAVKSVSADYIKVMGMGEAPTGASRFTFNTTVIVTTAVAETGLSLPDLRYVIDCGLSKESEFNPTENISSMLLSRPAAQSRILQRKGRVGRKAPGIFYPLYTEAIFDSLDKDQLPEILKLDPTALILTLASYTGQLGTPAEVRDQLLDVPTKPAMLFSIHKLQLLGFLDAARHITATGRIAARVTSVLSPEAIASIFASFTWGCSIDDVIAIGVMMKYRYGTSSYVGRSEADKQELKKQKRMDEVARNEPNHGERERLLGGITGGDDEESSEKSAPISRSLYYPLRLLIADDFIEQLIPFRMIESKWAEDGISGAAEKRAAGKFKPPPKKPTLPIGAADSNSARYHRLQQWAKSCFLNLDQLLKAYDDYVSVKSELCAAGIDIMAGRSNALMPLLAEVTNAHPYASAALTDMLTRLKLCLYHGYKMNCAEAIGPGQYRMVYGGHIFNWSFFGGDPTWRKYNAPYTYVPQRLIVHATFVGAKKGKYLFNVQGVGVLDGFV